MSDFPTAYRSVPSITTGGTTPNDPTTIIVAELVEHKERIRELEATVADLTVRLRGAEGMIRDLKRKLGETAVEPRLLHDVMYVERRRDGDGDA